MEKSQRKARFARWTLTRRAGGARPAGFTRSGLRPSLIHPAGRFHSKFLNYFLITWSHIIDKCTQLSLLSLTENLQAQNFVRGIVSSDGLCYNGNDKNFGGVSMSLDYNEKNITLAKKSS